MNGVSTILPQKTLTQIGKGTQPPMASRSRMLGILGISTATIGYHSTTKALRNDAPNQSASPHNTKRAESTPRSSGSGAQPSHKDGDTDAGSSQARDATLSEATFSSNFNAIRTSVQAVQWSRLGDKLVDYVVPAWAHQLPSYLGKLQSEIEMRPGSLADEIWLEAQDALIHPEVANNARVRISEHLCEEEQAFIRRRKRCTTRALAKYLGLPESEVDPRDVPTIAICGSGGGLRALVSGASSYYSAQKAGLFDCATYTAGVSGSCWLQALYHSSLSGRRLDGVLDHLKKRIGTHIAHPPSFLELLTTAPTNKYLLAGTIERLKGDTSADFGIVDIYGLLLGTRLLVPKDEIDVQDGDMKLSNQRKYVENGLNPLPIYTAVRHELPELEEKKSPDKDNDKEALKAAKEKAKHEAWFQWFEFTPFEVWCEEFNAGIPTYSMGRHFLNGETVSEKTGQGLPELRMPFLMGIWGSAFCATLSHYYKEIRPLVKGLAGFEGIDKTLEERDDELIRLHPIDPGTIPNFALGLKNQLPPTCPKSIFEDEYLDLMDAGMSNNLPIYPLLRQGRGVDIIVCFDSSADIKNENWLSVVDGYAKQRGLKGWPVGAGWPRHDTPTSEADEALDTADAVTPDAASKKITETAQGKEGADLGYCNVWVGTTLERTSTEEPPQSKLAEPDADLKLMAPDAGITVVYFPFIPNPKVDGLDPATTPFLSTWNFIYTPEQIDKVVSLARSNFEEGKEQTRRTVRAVYERKKTLRLEREGKAETKKWRRRVREEGDHFQ